MNLVKFFLTITLLTVAINAHGAELTYHGSCLWSGMIDLIVEDDLAYCAMVSGLMILDVSEPSAPVFVSRQYLAKGWPSCIRKQGDYVYIGESFHGYKVGGVLYVIDVSNPHAPRIAGQWNTPGNVLGFDIVDTIGCLTYAFTWGDRVRSGDSSGIQVLNMTDPNNLQLLGQLRLDGGIFGKVRLKGNYAYTTFECNIVTIDLSDPSQPEIVSIFWTSIDPGSGETYCYDGNSDYCYCSIDLELGQADSILIVADHDLIWPAGQSALTIVNVADPAHPSVISEFPLRGGIWGLSVRENFVLVGNDRWGTQIFDISDPAHPDSLGWYWEVYAGHSWLDDTLAYIIDYGPQPEKAQDSGPAGLLFSAEASGGLFPLELHVVNIAVPEAPVKIGAYPMPASVRSVAASGRYAYALHSDGTVYFPDEPDIHIIDLVNRALPEVAGTYVTAGTAEAAVIIDTLLYLAAGYNGLEILSLADPTNLQLIGHAPGIGARDIQVQGNYAYLACGSLPTRIFDISDPTAPLLVKQLGPGTLETVPVGDYLYTAGLAVYNISDPPNAWYVTRIPTPPSNNITAAGHYLFIGFEAFDLEPDPSHPVFVPSSGWVPGIGGDVIAHGDRLFGASGTIFTMDISDVPNRFVCDTITAAGEFDGSHPALAVDSQWLYAAVFYSLSLFERAQPTGIDAPEINNLPSQVSLAQNYPNPFNPGTQIAYELPRRMEVQLKIYNILGQQVTTLVDGSQPAGRHEVIWNGEKAASGIYLYLLKTPEAMLSRKMLLLK